jgi:hypothetical protein
MTAAQIAFEPNLARYLAEVMLTFRMPGASLVPHLQSEAGRWLTLMEWDFAPAARELLRMLAEVLADPGRLGRLLVTIAAEHGETLGPLSGAQARRAMDTLRGAGYGLVGEALLESVGLGYLADVHADGAAGASPVARVRGLIRSWLAGRLDLDLHRRFTTARVL